MELHDLKRINIIVGDNGSGKTSLAEAIFLAAGGHPQLALRIRGFRGFGLDAKLTINRNSFEELWKDLFFCFDQKRQISISLQGTPENTRSVKIRYSKDSEAVTLPIGKSTEDSTAIVPIVFEYRDSFDEAHIFPVGIGEEGLVVKGAAQVMPISFYTSVQRSNPQESAQRFSELSKQKKEGRFIETLRRVYPSIEDVSVVMNAGVPLLYASVKHSPQRMPLSLISEGSYRLASYLLGIADSSNGVVIIDEIENGFYFKKVSEVWKALYEFATEYNTQLFVSTHSLECLKAAAKALKGPKRRDELAMLRTVKEGVGSIVRQFPGTNFLGAVESDIEVR